MELVSEVHQRSRALPMSMRIEQGLHETLCLAPSATCNSFWFTFEGKSHIPNQQSAEIAIRQGNVTPVLSRSDKLLVDVS